MIERKSANQIELIEFTGISILHAVYASVFMEREIAMWVWVYAVLLSILAGVALFCIKDWTKSQICFIVFILVNTNLIGSKMGTLAFGLCIYMIAGALISIIGIRKLNHVFILLVNVSIMFDLIVKRDVIARFIPFRYYILMIVFCEAFLVTEDFLITLYERKVKEVKIQNEQLDLARKSNHQFLANMSHEIRTPMNAIVGMSELIMRDEETTDRIKEYCYNIQSSGENLLGIINDILDFSKVESGKMDIIYEEYALASMVQNVTNTALFRKGYKDIDIIIDCSPKLPRYLIGDELRNRQILINLVNNAIKFTEKGFVYIGLKCFEKDGENWLQMKVEDTGVGIRQEDQVYLFEAFNRSDYLKNRYIEGSGLGLAICKQLVTLMRGTILIDSEYGIGTTITVEFPQQIGDASPFLSLKNASDIHVMTYIDKENHRHEGDDYYREISKDIWNTFHVDARECLEFSELVKQIEKGGITHILVGEDEYHDQKSYYDKVGKTVQVFVTHDAIKEPINAPAHIHVITAPFYSINIISALNGEALYNQFIDEKTTQVVFQAPCAKILVVDDNEVNLRVTEGILQLYQVPTVLARSGKEAIERLKEEDIDLVFMDHMMPELDGVETVEIIRRTCGVYGNSLPIVAMTANAVNDAKQMFLDHGFQDFLSKPISVKSVDGILRKWLPGNKLVFSDEKYRKKVEIFDEVEESDFVPMEIDAQTALSNMGGMVDLYKELLEYSVTMKENRLEELNACLAAKDYGEYQIQIHALKGAMRSLGVEELAQAALNLENLCKEKRYEEIIAQQEQFLQEYERGHKSIELYLSQM